MAHERPGISVVRYAITGILIVSVLSAAIAHMGTINPIYLFPILISCGPKNYKHIALAEAPPVNNPIHSSFFSLGRGFYKDTSSTEC